MRGQLQFDDLMVSEQDRYSIGLERTTGKHFIAVQFSQSFVDYEEHYELSEEEFDRLLDDPEAGREFARCCRAGEEDDRLFRRPGGPGAI